jgi:hypothetical protein
MVACRRLPYTDDLREENLETLPRFLLSKMGEEYVSGVDSRLADL